MKAIWTITSLALCETIFTGTICTRNACSGCNNNGCGFTSNFQGRTCFHSYFGFCFLFCNMPIRPIHHIRLYCARLLLDEFLCVAWLRRFKGIAFCDFDCSTTIVSRVCIAISTILSRVLISIVHNNSHTSTNAHARTYTHTHSHTHTHTHACSNDIKLCCFA